MDHFLLKDICYTPLPADLPKMRESRNNTIKMKNKIFAIEAAPVAIPVNPRIAAIIAIIKNVIVQRNIT
jgi:hypothetical protein